MIRIALPPLAFVLVSATMACTEPSPPAATAIDLQALASAPLPRIPLVPLALTTQADYDALEARWLGRRDGRDLLAPLRALADAQALAGKHDPLLLQRTALLVADELGADGRGLQASLEASTRLRDVAPDDPHTLWLNGWMIWQLMTRNGQMPVDGEAKSIVDALLQQWELLLQRAPDYVGPRGLGAKQVRADLARVRAAIAEAGVTPPKLPDASPRAATSAEIDALSNLVRFQNAADGNRRGICRDWREREPSAAPTGSELRMNLACATNLGDATAALPLIARLAATEAPAFDGCGALLLLGERSDAKALEAARSKTPLGFACPSPP